MTNEMSKQLLPIYDKPMIYYPLSVLMLAGIRDILVITTPKYQGIFERLLGDGSQFGVEIQFTSQETPGGIAQAFIIGEEFVGSDGVSLILGDNLFYGHGFSSMLEEATVSTSGARVFAYPVKNPENYGIVTLDSQGEPVEIQEKPINPNSNLAVTGLYFYDNRVVEIAKEIEPSSRGELEISSLNQAYRELGSLSVQCLGRGFTWLDAGTPEGLLQASQFVETIEKRQGHKIACLEEIAFNKGYITATQVEESAALVGGSQYGEYLYQLIKGKIN